jgi:3-oxoacyl-[acyl-carrier protein] reductase
MLKHFLPGMGADMDEAKERFRDSIPLGRMPEPIDTANAALFLASAEAGMITGIALPVDGGSTAG